MSRKNDFYLVARNGTAGKREYILIVKITTSAEAQWED
jgi:hypothetical protein